VRPTFRRVRRCAGSGGVATRAAGHLKLALLLAVELLFKRIDRGGGSAGVNADFARLGIERRRTEGAATGGAGGTARFGRGAASTG